MEGQKVAKSSRKNKNKKTETLDLCERTFFLVSHEILSLFPIFQYSNIKELRQIKKTKSFNNKR